MTYRTQKQLTPKAMYMHIQIFYFTFILKDNQTVYKPDSCAGGDHSYRNAKQGTVLELSYRLSKQFYLRNQS